MLFNPKVCMLLKVVNQSNNSRRIPLSHGSHVIGFQPLATGATEHESALERDFVILTTFQEPTARIISQPVTIKFPFGWVTRRYTPDFLVSVRVGSTELIEIKYSAALQENFDYLRPAFEAASAWAAVRQMHFRVVTEREIRGPALDNAKRLLPLRNAPLDLELATLVKARIEALAVPTLGGVLALGLADRAHLLATLWRMIAREALRVDLSAPITADTRILKP
jgi:hypothetical protein